MRIQFKRSSLDMSVHSVIAGDDDDNASTSSTLDVTDHQPAPRKAQQQEYSNSTAAPLKSVRFELSANTTRIQEHEEQRQGEEGTEKAQHQERWYNDKELESMRQAVFQDAREMLFRRNPPAAMCQRLLRRVYKESTEATTATHFDHSNSLRVIRQKLAEVHQQIPNLLGLEKLVVGTILEDCEQRRKRILSALSQQNNGDNIPLPDSVFGYEMALALRCSLESEENEDDDSDSDDSDDEDSDDEDSNDENSSDEDNDDED